MKTRFIALILFIFCFKIIYTQTIHHSLNTTGVNVTNANGKVSYSVGQVFYTIKGQHDGYVSEGVQQPYEISIVTETAETDGIKLNFLVYPNPSTNNLRLLINNYSLKGIKFQLFDVTGKMLEEGIINAIETTINMENKAKGIYFLKLYKQNSEIKSFKLIKN